ncbi:MAG: ATP-dependent Clp protease adaptor ClpS [Myxococcota bacterium]
MRYPPQQAQIGKKSSDIGVLPGFRRTIRASGTDDPGGDDPMFPESEGDVATETQKRLKRPKLYKVLLHNDDYTTMEFVIMVLMKVFHHSESEAQYIMLHVHTHGVGTAGIFTYEVAETKAQKTMELAREHQFPLRTSVEPAIDGDDE